MSKVDQKRRTRGKPEQHRERLLAILEANLARATSPDLRERLQRAIAAIKGKKAA
jgi:hypothetical protein